jgi:site-specific DNA-cytosine methylase
MNDQSSMFDPPTLPGSTSAISSPESAAGPTPSDLPDGPTTDQSGPAHVPVSRFRARDKQKGHADERHLWPAFYELIAECRPSTVFGEQVASKDGREWLAGVRADLEDARYAVGAADLCAAGVGAPHIRQRLFWVAQSPDARPPRAGGKPQPKSALIQPGNGSGKEGAASRVAHTDGNGADLITGDNGETAGLPKGQRPEHGPTLSKRSGADGGLADTDG